MFKKLFRRVSPCPCGSGLKYCRCHGSKHNMKLVQEAMLAARDAKMAEIIEDIKSRKKGRNRNAKQN